jgi:CBS domain-containing protein
MKASELMTGDPVTLTADDTVKRAAELMRDHDVGLIPIVEDTMTARLTGVITDRDIALRCVAEGRKTDCRIGDVMSTDDIARAGPDDSVDAIERRMRDRQVRRIPVVADDGRLVGIVAQADLARSEDAKSVGQTVEDISRPASVRA